jgi:hypothetical protein
MEAAIASQMLALFRSDESNYQPVHSTGPLDKEDGNPQASLGNLKRLNLPIQDIWVRNGFARVLFQFNTGEQYLALGLSDPKALAYIASDAGFGSFDELFEMYRAIPAEYEGKLPLAVEPQKELAQSILAFEAKINAERSGKGE